MDQVAELINRMLSHLNSQKGKSESIQTKSSKQQELSKCGCNGTGWVERTIENGTRVYAECKCQEINRMKSMLETSGISEEYQKISIKQYKTYSQDTIRARNIAIDYIKRFDEIYNSRSNSIAFLGQVGSGKTLLSIGIANAFMDKGISVMYMPFRDVITDLKQNMTDEEYYQQKVGRYKRAKVLLIDDLFKGTMKNGKVNESDVNIMFEIINHRYLNKAPIIVSSEFLPERLVDFDEAVGSRIIHMCTDFMVKFQGKENNFRLREIV